MTKRRMQQTVLAGVLALGLAVPASADEWTVEGFFGYYDPDSIDENGEVIGARVGYRVSDHFGMQLSGGWLDVEDDFFDIEESRLRVDFFVVDYSFQWYPTGRSFYLFAGPGLARIDLEVTVPGHNNNVKEHVSSFTIHGGLGYRWDIGKSFFVRPEFVARWFEGDDFKADRLDSYSGLDTQYSVGLGWHF
ncbi:MAG: porin family protein [Acidobacteria bacterium]|nr:porin family protein [Acidobacteriota bacterium]